MKPSPDPQDSDNLQTSLPMPPIRVRLQWKLAALAILAALLGAAVGFCSHTMKPFPDGSSADFWHAACGVQVDPGRRSFCTGPVCLPREGWFVYSGHDERYFALHGVETFRLPEPVALADFPRVVRLLEEGAHRAGANSMRVVVIDTAYRAWLVADPERKNPHALLACLQDAWLDRWRELDRLRERVPPASMAASVVAAWTEPRGQPWTAIVSIVEAESRLRVFKPSHPYSAVRTHTERETRTDRWWEQAKFWHWNAVGEFAYLLLLILFTAWPWLRNASPWRWGMHLGLLPILFYLPYWFGYAHWACPQLGVDGGVLYPSLIAYGPRFPRAPLDTWVWDRFPLLLYACSYPVDANTGWFQADLNSAWFGKSGPGPVMGLILGVILGLMIYGMRRVILMTTRFTVPSITPVGPGGGEGLKPAFAKSSSIEVRQKALDETGFLPANANPPFPSDP